MADHISHTTNQSVPAHNGDCQPDANGVLLQAATRESKPQSLLHTQTTSVSQASTEDPSPRSTSPNVGPWQKKFLLSLDGGGVRGYSTLLIIQELMKLCKSFEQRDDPAVNSSYHPIRFQPNQGSPVERRTRSLQFLPVHYFDYIAGTSTGGLIAIMLSRLRMSIDDCIEEYARMGEHIFGSPRRFSMRGPIPWHREKYDYRKLEYAIKDVVKRRHWKVDEVSESMYPSTPDRCRTIVVAVRENNDATAPYLFRTYEHPRSAIPNPLELNPGLPTQVPIWKVARATTAAPTYFKPIVIGSEKFLDGGWGTANNPAWHAYFEVGQMNGKNAVELTISVGTGRADRIPPVAKRGTGLLGKFKAIVKYAAATTTDSEETHLKMNALATRTGHNYERFNVDGGLGDVDLGEWIVKGGDNLTLRKIEAQTRMYLGQRDTRRRLERVAEMLVKNRQERSKDPKWNIVATGHRYHCTVDPCLPTLLFNREEDLRTHLIETHGWPAETLDQKNRLDKAIRQGKIPHAD